MKINVMKLVKYIKMCMLLNLARIFEILQELDVTHCPRSIKFISLAINQPRHAYT